MGGRWCAGDCDAEEKLTVRLEEGDCLEVIPRLVAEGIICDAVVCDPPYHLTDMTARFGKDGSRPPKFGKDGAMDRLAKGFMGQMWDGGDVAFRPETWATVATILRPGGFLLAFSGTRTYHRMVCAIEDAGFIIQNQIAWLYGSGFPKRRDDLKPAMEPVVVAYKPGGPRTLQIDECRIESEKTVGWGGGAAGGQTWNKENCGLIKDGDARPVDGRYPANVILSYPEDEYILREDVTPEQKKELYRWLSENS